MKSRFLVIIFLSYRAFSFLCSMYPESYSIEEIDSVCMYCHSSRIKQEERVNSNPFQGLVSPTLSKKEQKKLDEYFSDWGFRNEGI